MDDENRPTHFRPDEGMIGLPTPTSGGKEMDWKKTLMYGSFAAGAILFLSGRRPAGLAVAGIGVATFAVEHPEKFDEIWQRMPEYIERGERFVNMAANFLDRLGEHRSG